MQMKPYPKYKDSGIEWVGKIPEGWEVHRLRFMLRNGTEGIKIGPFGSMLKSDEIVYEGYKVYGQENAIKEDFSAGERYIKEEKFNELINYQIFPGDLIITMMGTTGKAKLVPDKIVLGIMDSHLIRLRFNKKFYSKFIQILINDSTYIFHELKYFSKGSIMEGLNSSIIKDLILTIPSKEEQEEIINYLDKKISEIDGLIAKNKKLIELEKEKKVALINQTVTKGLDTNVKFKDSGIESIGEIPEGWEACLIRFKTDEITDGAHISPDLENGEYAFISTVNVKNGKIDFVNCLQTSKESYKLLKAQGCKPKKGDILYSKDGTIGETVLVDEDKEFVVASSLIIIRPNIMQVKPDFFNYLLQSKIFFDRVNSFVKGSALKRISITNIKRIYGVFPSKPVQKNIAEYLDKHTARINKTIQKIDRKIELLEEYKQSLIHHVVTGKVDVRGIAA